MSVSEIVAQSSALRKKNDALLREIQTLRTEEHGKRAQLLGYTFLTVENWVQSENHAQQTTSGDGHAVVPASVRELQCQRSRLLGLQERFAVLHI